jgi:hypothetical protein
MKTNKNAQILLSAGFLIILAGFCMPFISLPLTGTKNGFTLTIWLGKNGYTLLQIILDCIIAAATAGLLLRLLKHAVITDIIIIFLCFISLVAAFFLLHGLYTNNTNAMTRFIGKFANSAVLFKYGFYTAAAGLCIAAIGLAAEISRKK